MYEKEYWRNETKCARTTRKNFDSDRYEKLSSFGMKKNEGHEKNCNGQKKISMV
jgi:hypothetical protein